MSTKLKQIHDDIIGKIDIVNELAKHITLTRKGQSYVSLCPFHDDSNPSMNISSHKQIFKCFVCGEGGDVVKFVSKFKKITYTDALKYLLNSYNISYDQNTFYDANSKYNETDLAIFDLLERVNSLFKLEFNKLKNSKLNDFYTSRKLTPQLINDFDIGYADPLVFEKIFSDEINQNKLLFIRAGLINTNTDTFIFKNRVTFAIRNNDGKIVGFSARSIDKNEKPKYINSSESKLFQKSQILYNYYLAKNNIKDNTLIICEGFFDVIALYKANFKNSVALMGTALTNKHLPFLKDKKIVLFLDGDEAGQSASIKSAQFLLANNINVNIVNNKTKMDPDEILNQLGPNKINELINQSVDSLDFIFNTLIIRHNVSSGEQNNLTNISKFIHEFSEYIKFAPTNVQEFYINKIKEKFKYDASKDIESSSLNQTFNDFDADYEFNNIANLNDIDNFTPMFGNEPINQTPHFAISKKKNKKINKLSNVDKLFYLILYHDDLRELFIEKAANENTLRWKTHGWEPYQIDIYQNITNNPKLTSEQKDRMIQQLSDNFEPSLKLNELIKSFNSNNSQAEKINDFMFIYDLAKIESFKTNTSKIINPDNKFLFSSSNAALEQQTEDTRQLIKKIEGKYGKNK